MKTPSYIATVVGLLCSTSTLATTPVKADAPNDVNYVHQDLQSVAVIKNDIAVNVKAATNTNPYNQQDAQGRYVIDTLMVLTPEAEQEILYKGVSLEQYLGWRIDALNQTLLRSQITNSVVRLLGYHVLTNDDFARTGTYPNGPLANIGQTPRWLSTYREAYGADKVMLIGASSEPNNNAAYGGGDFSSYFVQFLPIEHEFGHMMGASHCNNGLANGLNYGFPVVGYTADGHVDGPSFAGTRMCGNSIAFYSNPDIELSLAEIEQFVSQGLMPAGDYQALLDENGRLKMGDEIYANFAQVWRDNAEYAANRQVATKPILTENQYYPQDDCVGLYANADYSGFVAEICDGSKTGLNGVDIQSVLLGKNVQVNLYSDSAFGEHDICGGELLQSAYSINDLAGLSQARGYGGFDTGVGSVLVYAQDDHVSHFRHSTQFEYATTGKFSPKCLANGDDSEVEDAHNLKLMADNIDWSGTAALFKPEVKIPFELSFKVRVGHQGPRFNGEGFSFFFAKDNEVYQQQNIHWNDIGFIRDGLGYSIEFHDVLNKIYLLDGKGEKLSPMQHHGVFTFGQWAEINIEVSADSVVVLWDGIEVVNHSHQFDQTHTGIGFGSGTGYYTSDIALTDIKITPEKCLNIASYDVNAIYTGGEQVLLNGLVYQARWWNTQQSPAEHSGQWRVWESLGSCFD
jgi:hypothetical protein